MDGVLIWDAAVGQKKMISLLYLLSRYLTQKHGGDFLLSSQSSGVMMLCFSATVYFQEVTNYPLLILLKIQQNTQNKIVGHCNILA